MPRFISLAYSPWSEKARWALVHHGIEFDPIAYPPMVGELPLRAAMGKWRGNISVPILQHAGGWLSDSWDIARWAEAHGTGTPLFPEGQLEAVQRFNALSEEGLAAARALALPQVLEAPASLAALVPRPLDRLLGPVGPAMAAAGVRRTLKKYGAHQSAREEHARRLEAVLDRVRRTLGEGDDEGAPRTLLDGFSYADIAVAQVLQFVAPANLGGFRLGAAGRKGYRIAGLAERYPDLVAWRDALYRTYHPAERQAA